MRTACSASSEGLSPSSFTARRSCFQRRRTTGASASAARPRAAVGEHGVRRGAREVGAELFVARLAQHREQVGLRRRTIGVEAADHPPRRFGLRRAAVDRHVHAGGRAAPRYRGRCRARIPTTADRRCSSDGPMRVDEVLERDEVGAQSAGRDPGLVHRLGIVADAEIGFVREQTLVRLRDRPPHDRGHPDLLVAHGVTLRGRGPWPARPRAPGTGPATRCPRPSRPCATMRPVRASTRARRRRG